MASGLELRPICSYLCLGLLLFAASASGCVSPYAWHYMGKTLAQLNGSEPWLAAPAESTDIEMTDDHESALRQRLEEGWVLLGTAM